MSDIPQDSSSGKTLKRRKFLEGAASLGLGSVLTTSTPNALESPVSSENLQILHTEERRSHRVLWLMEELGGLPYKLIMKQGDIRGSIEMIRTAHLMGMFPTIIDGDIVMVESGAILEYIINTYGNGRLAIQPSEPHYPDYLMWMHFAEGSASPRIIADFTIRTFPDPQSQSSFASIQLGGTKRVLTFMESVLSKYEYIAGENFTAADIMMHFPVKAARLWGVDLQNYYPHIATWMARMESREGFILALEKGSPNGPLEHPASISKPLLYPDGSHPSDV